MSQWTSEQLEACVRRHLPQAEGPIAFEPIRTGKFNTSFFVRAGGEDLVLRIAPPADSVFYLLYELQKYIARKRGHSTFSLGRSLEALGRAG